MPGSDVSEGDQFRCSGILLLPLTKPSSLVRFLFLLGFAFCSVAEAATPAWESTVTKDPPGSFPEPKALHATYNVGWSGLTAATGDVSFSREGNRFQFDGTGRTIGLARALWRYDVTFKSQADASSLRPLETTQNESFCSKKIATHLAFNSNGVTRTRTENGKEVNPKTFNMPYLNDLLSAVLYLRSQPLKEHSTYKVVVYPTTSAYVATVTVRGREHLKVRAGSYNAIKMDLQLSKVNKELGLEPHKKFRKATIWISDDANRLVLRVEAQIFIGTIFTELQSVKFDQPNS